MAERDNAHTTLTSGATLAGGLLRSLNEQRVLEAIVRQRHSSQAQIAACTGLARHAVAAAVSGLERIELIRSCGVGGAHADGASPDGGSVTVYEVGGRAGYVFGVDLGGTKIRAGLADLYGTVLEQFVEPTARHRHSNMVDLLSEMLDAVLRRTGVDGSLVRAAALGVPGVYEPGSDTITGAYNLPPLESGVAAASVQALGIPLMIDNDVNLAAVGECWRGHANDCTDYVVIAIGTGVGMGVVINGEVHRGANGAAGEIGLLPLGVDDSFGGARDDGGPYESVASGIGALRYLRRLVETQGEATSLTVDSTLSDALEAAARGDNLGLKFVDHQARLIALGVGSVCSVLDPQLVVLGGGLGANPILLPPVRQYVEVLLRRFPRIEVSGLGDRAGFYGAIAMGLAGARNRLLEPLAETRHRRE